MSGNQGMFVELFEVLYRLHYGVLYNYAALVAVSVFAKVDRDLV